jgi:uncharacterized protein (TIGR03083 family)
MQLAPVYGDLALIDLDGPPGAIAAPAIAQRRRFVAELEALDADAWSVPSRCEGWTAREVVSHLDSTNAFWTFSLRAGLAGRPSRFLTTFDPVASPAQLAEADDRSPAGVLDGFAASTEAFCSLLTEIDEDGWSALVEAPPGHLTASALAHHALWDAWVHERDVLLPLGIEPPVVADEVIASLRYGPALGPALARGRGEDRHGRIAVRATDPELACTIDVGEQIAVRAGADPDAEVTLDGPAVDLLEALSMRTPLLAPVPDEHAWLLDGLATTFDATR